MGPVSLIDLANPMTMVPAQRWEDTGKKRAIRDGWRWMKMLQKLNLRPGVCLFLLHHILNHLVQRD